MNSNTYDEIEFRKKINKINTLRSILKDKKNTYSKLIRHPECFDECEKLQREIKKLEYEIAKLQ